MPIFTNSHKKVLFIHIPKAAGSTIERTFKDLGWQEEFSVRGRGAKELEYYKAVPQHIHAEIISMLFNTSLFDARIAIVRNPYDRMKSEYYWQVAQGLTKLPVNSWFDNITNEYGKNTYLCDNHIRPQYEFINNLENVSVFKLEENGIGLARRAILDLMVKKPFTYQFKEYFGLLDYSEKKSQKLDEVESEFVKLRGSIYEFYSNDYKVLGYQGA